MIILLEFVIHWGSFLGCLSIVLWQIHIGASKYFSHPIATKTYTEDIISPHITVCHEFPASYTSRFFLEWLTIINS